MQPNHTPTWIDLETDVAQAQAFYGAVLGWSTRPLPSAPGWVVATVDGKDVAALGPGKPRPWALMLRADDIDSRMAAAGERVSLPVGAVGSLGRLGRVVPPGGGELGLWAAGEFSGFSLSGAVGTPVWFELRTTEVDAAAGFFATWLDVEPKPLGGDGSVALFCEGRPRFGVRPLWAEEPDVRWLVYFAVASADSAAEAVQSAGGVVAAGPQDTPFGRVFLARDPMGAVFACVQAPG